MLGVLTCKALISSYNLDIIILFVLRFMPRSLNIVPARLTLADFAMFFCNRIAFSDLVKRYYQLIKILTEKFLVVFALIFK